MEWDATKIKAQMRLCTQRLGQLQDKKDSQGQITRRDIATLLQQEQVALARAKAQKLAREDALEVLLQVLEMHISVVLEHFAELESKQPSPSLVEAASSIIYAAHHFEESKELIGVSQVLGQRLGPDFTRSAIGNQDAYVSPQVVGALSAPPPTAARLDEFLAMIAKAYSVEWTPALRPHERLNALSELLSPESSAPVIDMHRLRTLCDLGIPGHPPWLRPRIWRLCFGTLPILKSSWADEAEKQRTSYYDLIRRLLEPFTQLSPSTTLLTALDKSLLDTSKELSRVPPSLFSELEDEPESSDLCPLDPSSTGYISCSGALDSRLELILASSDRAGPMPTPEIRLEEHTDTPKISVTEPLSPTVETTATRQASLPTTLHPSKAFGALAAHPHHHSALLRLLYVHSSLNPASRSPHVASIMVPLYSVLVQEIEPTEVAHAEADTFWLFEAIISEFAELEDEEGGKVALQRFGERVAWADEELFSNLHAKGLDPAMPHYSYRWFAPLLAHTLPLPSVFAVWDAIFSREPRNRSANARLDYLLDVCTSMLVRARGPLFRLGKSGRRSPGLWGEVDTSMPPPSPLRPWELGDAFLEGMSLLQVYNVEAAGGVESILQTAADFAHRRQMDAKRDQGQNVGIGARLRDTMWRGFTNRVTDIEEEEEDSSEESTSEEETSHDEGNVTETGAPGVTSRWANSVWKGITNQSAMEAVPPTPISPARHSPLSPIPPLSATLNTASPSNRLSIWDYTAKLKDSDTAATLAKVSSNWRAKALTAWGSGAAPVLSSSVSEPPTSPATRRDSAWQKAGIARHESLGKWPNSHGRSESLNQVQTQAYSPPPKPAFFRPPRDSWMPSPHSRRASNSSIASGDASSPQESTLVDKAKALQDSLSALTGLQMPVPKPAPKSAPRPLLLNSTTLLTGHTRTPSLSRGHTPTPSIPRVPSDAALHLRRDSQSSAASSSVGPSNRESLFSMAPSNRESISSLAPSGRESWDSDKPSSRVVPLRRSRSPMAPTFAAARSRTSTAGSDISPAGSDGHLSTGSDAATIARRPRSREGGWGQVDADSLELAGNGHSRMGSGSSKVTIVQQSDGGITSDSSVAGIPIPKSPRGLRSKRNYNRPASIRTGLGTASEMLVAPENPEAEEAVTPRAAQFGDSDSPVSTSSAADSPVEISKSPRRRKLSSNSRKSGGGEPRTRKVSGGSMHRPRDSEAEHGDDEGYDDLLSAYESEDGSRAVR